MYVAVIRIRNLYWMFSVWIFVSFIIHVRHCGILYKKKQQQKDCFNHFKMFEQRCSTFLMRISNSTVGRSIDSRASVQ